MRRSQQRVSRGHRQRGSPSQGAIVDRQRDACRTPAAPCCSAAIREPITEACQLSMCGSAWYGPAEVRHCDGGRTHEMARGDSCTLSLIRRWMTTNASVSVRRQGTQLRLKTKGHMLSAQASATGCVAHAQGSQARACPRLDCAHALRTEPPTD